MVQAKELEVIVLAAGRGTRMCSDTPKVLHKVCGLSLLERTLRAAAGLGPTKIVVVVGYGREALDAELTRLKVQPRFSGITLEAVLQETQQGTGHATKVAMPAITPSCNRVLVLPGDSPLITTAVLEELSGKQLESELVFLTAVLSEPHGFGRILRGAKNEVLRIIEQKDCGEQEKRITETNASIYLAGRAFLEEALGALKPNNAQGEYYLTDIVGHAVEKGLSPKAVIVSDYLSVQGANTRFELSGLEQHRRERINRRWLEHGVSMEDPKAVYIDEDVELGTDCFLGAGTRLKGVTRIGDGVIIEGDSLIVDSTLAKGCKLKLGCYLERARVGENCQVGPFAHLRPDAVLEKGVKIGNFVEVKNSVMEAGAKANHLAYIGDSSIGAESNIGAGTITCNYDGTHKHRTTVGAGSFVGSNSTLVAPVTIGDGAYVGAGSTIVTDVPSGALGVGRSRQRNIEGWMARRAPKPKKGSAPDKE